MKRKMLTLSLAAVTAFALLGCQQQQQQQPAVVQPEVKTSTASLQIMPPTQQNSSAKLEIVAPTQEGGTVKPNGTK